MLLAAASTTHKLSDLYCGIGEADCSNAWRKRVGLQPVGIRHGVVASVARSPSVYLLVPRHVCFACITQPKSKKSSKKQTVKFVIDCFIPVEDRVLDPASFEKFLHDRIKVNGKAGQLGDVVIITREKVRYAVRVACPARVCAVNCRKVLPHSSPSYIHVR